MSAAMPTSRPEAAHAPAVTPPAPPAVTHQVKSGPRHAAPAGVRRCEMSLALQTSKSAAVRGVRLLRPAAVAAGGGPALSFVAGSAWAPLLPPAAPGLGRRLPLPARPPFGAGVAGSAATGGRVDGAAGGTAGVGASAAPAEERADSPRCSPRASARSEESMCQAETTRSTTPSVSRARARSDPAAPPPSTSRAPASRVVRVTRASRQAEAGTPQDEARGNQSYTSPSEVPARRSAAAKDARPRSRSTAVGAGWVPGLDSGARAGGAGLDAPRSGEPAWACVSAWPVSRREAGRATYSARSMRWRRVPVRGRTREGWEHGSSTADASNAGMRIPLTLKRQTEPPPEGTSVCLPGDLLDRAVAAAAEGSSSASNFTRASPSASAPAFPPSRHWNSGGAGATRTVLPCRHCAATAASAAATSARSASVAPLPVATNPSAVTASAPVASAPVGC
eukprot:scaffold17383_cov93-Isochrysis_galbana.AAC.4